MYEEGQSRAKILAEKGVSNWLNLPEKDRFQPIFVVVDELSALTVTDPVPKGVPKDHPVVMEINQMNFLRALIYRFINKIVAEMRFVGVRMVLSTQVTNASTSLPPSLKEQDRPPRPGRLEPVPPGPQPGVQRRDRRRRSARAREVLRWSRPRCRGGRPGGSRLGGLQVVLRLGLRLRSPTARAGRADQQEACTDRRPGGRARARPHRGRGCPGPQRAPARGAHTSGKPVSSLPPELGPGPRQTGADGKALTGAAAASKALKAPAATIQAGPVCPACDKPINPTTGECGCTW